MKGNQQVIEKLNELLAGELSAMDQYFIHSRMYDDWGLSKLHERIDHEFEGSHVHISHVGKQCHQTQLILWVQELLNIGACHVVLMAHCFDHVLPNLAPQACKFKQ